MRLLFYFGKLKDMPFKCYARPEATLSVSGLVALDKHVSFYAKRQMYQKMKNGIFFKSIGKFWEFYAFSEV